MTYVYALLVDTDYEGSELLGVFSTMKLAKDRADRPEGKRHKDWSGGRTVSYRRLEYGQQYRIERMGLDA